MKLYKIKPIKWEKQTAGDWDMRGYPLWAAVTAVALYEIEKVRNGYRLVIDGHWHDRLSFKTRAEAEQEAKKDYLERIEYSLEAVEAEPAKVKLSAVVISAEEVTGIKGAMKFEIKIDEQVYAYSTFMDMIAEQRIQIIPALSKGYDYSGAGFIWLKNWLKDFREE